MTQLSDMRAKQGGSGRPVLGVLLTSLALLAVAITGYMFWVNSSSPPSAEQESSRQSIQSTGSTESTRQIKPENPAYPAPANRSADTPVRQP